MGILIILLLAASGVCYTVMVYNIGVTTGLQQAYDLLTETINKDEGVK